MRYFYSVIDDALKTYSGDDEGAPSSPYVEVSESVYFKHLDRIRSKFEASVAESYVEYDRIVVEKAMNRAAVLAKLGLSDDEIAVLM